MGGFTDKKLSELLEQLGYNAERKDDMFFHFKLEDWQIKEMQAAIDKARTEPKDYKSAIFMTAYRRPGNSKDIFLKGMYLEGAECEKIRQITKDYIERIKNDGD